MSERRDRDRVLEQAAEVRVVAGPRARRQPPRRAQLVVGQQSAQQRLIAAVVDLAGEVLQKAVELVEVAVGRRQEAGGIDVRRRLRRAISDTSSTSSSRNRSTTPTTWQMSPRSNWPPSASAF